MRAKVIRELIDEIRALRAELDVATAVPFNQPGTAHDQ